MRFYKEKQAREILKVLSETSASLEELDQATKLGPVVYPILADLHKKGLIEHHWIQTTLDSKLTYHITLKGMRHLSSPKQEVASWTLTEPFWAKIKSWFLVEDK